MPRALLPTPITKYFFYEVKILRLAIMIMNPSFNVNFCFIPLELFWISDLVKKIVGFSFKGTLKYFS